MSEISPEVAEFVKKIRFAEHLGVRIDSLDKGIARLSLEVKPEFTTSWGTVHGGAILSLLDITLSMSARTLYNPPRSIMTVDLSAQFIGTATGMLRAEGRVTHAGKSTIFCEGEVKNEKDELVAKAIGTFRGLEPKK
jgi:uncharacterized protein (TIGR00369 family)